MVEVGARVLTFSGVDRAHELWRGGGDGVEAVAHGFQFCLLLRLILVLFYFFQKYECPFPCLLRRESAF